jgi:hypothetical protein
MYVKWLNKIGLGTESSRLTGGDLFLELINKQIILMSFQ